MIDILTWVSLIAGGILVLLLLLSLIGGMDLDVDVEAGSTDVDAGGGGLGAIKGVLTFVSVTSWVMKMLLMSKKHMALVIVLGILAGIVALFLLNYMIRLLMKNESYVNWKMEDALFQSGNVYLKIPKGGKSGIINVEVKGVKRELKAKSFDGKEIKTGSEIDVMDVDGEFAIVKLKDN